jgi:hypothetical protein
VKTNIHPYATLAYAKTLTHIGRPMYVRAWDSHIIVRDVDQNSFDAIGPYPIACLAPGSDLRAGLEDLRQAGMISVVLVVDGLWGPPHRELEQAFSSARPYKTHYLVDSAAGQYLPTSHHRYEIRRAANRGIEIQMVYLRDILDEWTELYDHLIARHQITGAQRFSRTSFEALACCDGLVTLAAYLGETVVACHIWFQHEGFVWSHLAATNLAGYRNGASFALYDYSIRMFSRQLINLGGAAGLEDATDDGLALLKAGFSNRKHRTHLYGAVLDLKRYNALCSERGVPVGDYFPLYRVAPTSQ